MQYEVRRPRAQPNRAGEQTSPPGRVGPSADVDEIQRHTASNPQPNAARCATKPQRPGLPEQDQDTLVLTVQAFVLDRVILARRTIFLGDARQD